MKSIRLARCGLLVSAVIAVGAGCASAPKTFEDPNGNVHLGVYAEAYNFSLQMTRVYVEFDGKPAVNKTFGTSSAGHRDSHYQFYLAPGTHTVRATANKGGAEAQQTFEVKNQIYIAVHFKPATAPDGGGLTIQVSEQPIFVRPSGGA